MKLFNEYYNTIVREAEQVRNRIGFFPGGFKPPHAGHFAALQAILGYDVRNPETGEDILLDGATISDNVNIIIGHAPRGSADQNDIYRKMKSRKGTSPEDLKSTEETMITKEMSMKVWEMYISDAAPEMKNKVNVSISSHASPIIGMEQAILGLDSKTIGSSVLNLYAGEEDQKRYEYFTSEKFRMKIADEKRLPVESIYIQSNKIGRLGSATDARSQIMRIATQEADMETLSRFIPPGVNTLNFMNLLQSFHRIQ